MTHLSRGSFGRLFDEYWRYVLARFERGDAVEYRPKLVGEGKGNIRRVREMNASEMWLAETSTRGANSHCTRNELREDFWRLTQGSVSPDARAHVTARS